MMQLPMYRYLTLWAKERESIRMKRSLGLPKPWTDDPVLQMYRFCNVRREHDAVTIWIKEHWREPYAHNPHLLIAMCAARLFNLPETLEAIGFPENGLDIEKWRSILKERQSKKQKVFNAAYIVSTNGHPMNKVDYVLGRVLTPVNEAITNGSLVITPLDTLETAHAKLMQFDGFGSFIAAQVVADLKHTPLLSNAVDWYSWAAIGPGSKRGLNRLADRSIESNITKEEFLTSIAWLREKVSEELRIDLDGQDIQNCLCETDKYVRVLLKAGTPKQRFPGY